MKLILNVFVLLVIFHAAYSRSVTYGRAQMHATMQENLNAAIEGWWDNIYDTVKTGCSYIPLNDANAQFLGTLTGIYGGVKGACDLVNGGKVTAQGLFGISLEDIKNKAKQAFDYARAGCEKYDSNNDLARELIGEDKAEYVDILCHGLSGSNPAMIQHLVSNSIRSAVEEKKAKLVLSSLAN